MNIDIFNGNKDWKIDRDLTENYNVLQDRLGLQGIQDIFFLCLLIGYRHGEKKSYDAINTNGGKEFRPSYFREGQKNILYTIAYEITKGEIFINYNSEVEREIKREFQAYASAGMNILINDAFDNDLNHGDLDVELSHFLENEFNNEEVPF